MGSDSNCSGKMNWMVTVAPFECEWLVGEGLRFREAGRGCITFEACADNDITLVFKEHAGSKHYHYRRDNTPNYTIVLGSHRNRRLKIEVDGKSVVDAVGTGLCCSSGFESYWISICDGLISVGKGTRPGHHIVFQWLDSQPNCKVQYIGLSSWDKHVGYRNIRVLPSSPLHDGDDGYDDDDDDDGDEGAHGLKHFFQSWELADFRIVVGREERVVPAHRIVLGLCCTTSRAVLRGGAMRLPSVEYSILRALLQYLYTGRTQVLGFQLEALRKLSEEFGVEALVDQCKRYRGEGKGKGKGKWTFKLFGHPLPFSSPINLQKLEQSLQTGEYSDVDIYIEGYGLIARAHKLVLSLWSAPFAKMFTIGMSESNCSEVCLRDVCPEAFLAMLHFMYSGRLQLDEIHDVGSLLLPLILLADRFGIHLLQQECCEYLVECLSEDSVCPILQVVTLMAACRPLQEACEEYFSKHFDYCTTASTGFRMLEESSFRRILQHSDLAVTSEERVLDAVLMWGAQVDDIHGWEAANEWLNACGPDTLFAQRLQPLNELLPLVRFPLMPHALLQKLELSNLSKKIPVFQQLITEALQYLDSDASRATIDQRNLFKSFDINNEGRLIQFASGSIRFHHRPSSFKELLYICDGDNNGVIYYAGTSYGEHPWMNPVLTKKVSVTASSPLSRYTDAKALASRRYQATSFAGPCLEGGRICAWWKVDLGEDHQYYIWRNVVPGCISSVEILCCWGCMHIIAGIRLVVSLWEWLPESLQLMCNYYTIRQDGSMGYIRSWSLQGSSNGEHWTDLRIHNNDQSVCRPGQFASWPIHGAHAFLPFQFFRVILTGPTTCESNPWNLGMCYLELYGYFR